MCLFLDLVLPTLSRLDQLSSTQPLRQCSLFPLPESVPSKKSGLMRRSSLSFCKTMITSVATLAPAHFICGLEREWHLDSPGLTMPFSPGENRSQFSATNVATSITLWAYKTCCRRKLSNRTQGEEKQKGEKGWGKGKEGPKTTCRCLIPLLHPELCRSFWCELSRDNYMGGSSAGPKQMVCCCWKYFWTLMFCVW